METTALVIVRSVRLDDLDALWQLLGQATYGLTTLQISKDQLSERVELSDFAFKRSAEKPTGEPYVFVMEDTSSSQLVGVSCIFSKTGGYEPFYSYRRVQDATRCELLDKTLQVESLQLVKIHDGPTEIGSLFLSAPYRGQGRGRLLSLARFAFIAARPQRFAEQVIAEMRGVMSDDGECPFWEAIGRHFFDMDFPQADTLSTINKRFIEDLMPRYPIYTRLLPESARAILGEVHRQTRPALAMLEAEGFQKTDLIDIFDGGPVVRCRTKEVRAVQRTRACIFGGLAPAQPAALRSTTGSSYTSDPSSAPGESTQNELVRQEPADRATADPASGQPSIVAALKSGFRGLIAHTYGTDDRLILDERSAAALELVAGDAILVTPLYPN